MVVCNTDWLNGAMRERYQKPPRNKFVTLTNGFDDVEAPHNLDLKKHKPLRCFHLGGIYGGRRIDTFCAGLSILVKKHKLHPNAVRVLFLGDTDESYLFPQSPFALAKSTTTWRRSPTDDQRSSQRANRKSLCD